MIEDKNFEQACNKAGHEIMLPYITQKEYIYIDADLLYDFKLAAVMACIKNEQDYNYVMECVPEYLRAPNLECARYFPKLGLTEQRIEEILNDPKYEIAIATIVPRTQFLLDLEKTVALVHSINQSKETDRPVHIIFNESKHKLSKILRAQLSLLMKKIDPRIIVEFTEFHSWYDTPEKFLAKLDMIAVYDVIEFLRVGTVSQKMISEVPSGLAKASIVALAQTTLVDADDAALDKAYENTSNILSMMCDQFTFVSKKLITKDSVK